MQVPHLPHLAGDVVLDVRVHPTLQERARNTVLLSQAILKGVLTVQGVCLKCSQKIEHNILVATHLAHAKDEVLNNGLVELADGAKVEHGVDRADGVPPLTLVPDSCLNRTSSSIVFDNDHIQGCLTFVKR